MLNSEKISQTFNGLVEWNVFGAYFKLLSSVTAVTVSLFRRGQRVLTATAVEGGYYQRIEFDRVQITTPSSQAVSWIYAPGDGGIDRLTGEVAVIDGGKARTLAGSAFVGGHGAGGVAGQYTHLQLLNPAASGKRVIIEQLMLSSPAAANLIGSMESTVTLSTLNGAWPNKLAAGAAGVAEMRREQNAAALQVNSPSLQFNIGASIENPYVFKEPLILLAGY